jgi:hypothetical protein
MFFIFNLVKAIFAISLFSCSLRQKPLALLPSQDTKNIRLFIKESFTKKETFKGDSLSSS